MLFSNLNPLEFIKKNPKDTVAGAFSYTFALALFGCTAGIAILLIPQYLLIGIILSAVPMLIALMVTTATTFLAKEKIENFNKEPKQANDVLKGNDVLKRILNNNTNTSFSLVRNPTDTSIKIKLEVPDLKSKI